MDPIAKLEDFLWIVKYGVDRVAVCGITLADYVLKLNFHVVPLCGRENALPLYLGMLSTTAV